jgi:hypothetical protein
MRKALTLSRLALVALVISSCDQALDPKPVDLVTNDVVLNEPKDVAIVETGLYRAFRFTRAPSIMAGDLTADNLDHLGTFSQYREIAVKQITTGNATVSELWSDIYGSVYISNFIIERLPDVPGVTTAVRDRTMATAYFLRGLANFQGVVTYGGIPKVITTDIETNRNIGRTSEEDMLKFIEEDYLKALGKLGDEPQPTSATVCNNTVRAALARLYLYTKNYTLAEQYATTVIESGDYTLEAEYSDAALTDFSSESIFEVGFTLADSGEGTSLSDLFISRREMIPTNEMVVLLNSSESHDRVAAIKFVPEDFKGADNGYQVAEYGTKDSGNDNILVFGLPEMYLIRAEARTMLGNVSGTNSAQADVNVLRTRAKAPNVGAVSQSQMQQIIETERRIELAYEGHRWYDLRRTGRIEQVMPAFNSNWKAAFELWPIPQREIQNNPALAGEQNPGY